MSGELPSAGHSRCLYNDRRKILIVCLDPIVCYRFCWLFCVVFLSSTSLSQFNIPLQISLSVQDIETILNTLIYDGKAEMILITDVTDKAGTSSHEMGGVQKKLYRAVKPVVPVPGLMRVPCGVCPVSIEKTFHLHYNFESMDLSFFRCSDLAMWRATSSF